MAELREKSGLPLKLEGNKLVFGKPLKQVKAEARTLEQMKPVLLEPNAKASQELYFMYRNVCLEKHRKKIEENGLRYDLTVIPPATIGKEFIKTMGHFHPNVPSTSVAFPEVYEVLHGAAHYLLQKKDGSDAVVLKAVTGEKALIPPSYGHITINAGKETLVMSNWVSMSFSSEYGAIKEKHGGMYFETVNGWVKNNNYSSVPKLREVKAKNVEIFGLIKNKPMYFLAEEIEKLEFLNKPQNYLEVFEKYLK
ncbi:MAG: glucose-6-phosphate isomerase [Candidatus Diapherotrites archaeon]|uniref:glucose-6-phosphate isomerase n=1 Tax=Candidatus Iainarchaeum sp. TaxID=3101447 RepID=A0A7J4ISJ2_9ARCH|nr:MAG: glucose-6-phosphate isomerase, archaeal [archaeon GW2011_AR10]MBS3059799.1 glucose-6-phosphate isomerase [Candidatus Diapherotrites archaeon]HIH08432.1 glucose-6-phosphate isomerase [Candidatus Diapherotrites archaeon]